MSREVILFDEPAFALDPEGVGEVLQVMEDLSSEDYTMMVVTHEMDSARAVPDQEVFLDKGEIIEKAIPQMFFSSPETERVMKLLEWPVDVCPLDDASLMRRWAVLYFFAGSDSHFRSCVRLIWRHP